MIQIDALKDNWNVLPAKKVLEQRSRECRKELISASPTIYKLKLQSTSECIALFHVLSRSISYRRRELTHEGANQSTIKWFKFLGIYKSLNNPIEIQYDFLLQDNFCWLRLADKDARPYSRNLAHKLEALDSHSCLVKNDAWSINQLRLTKLSLWCYSLSSSTWVSVACLSSQGSLIKAWSSHDPSSNTLEGEAVTTLEAIQCIASLYTKHLTLKGDAQTIKSDGPIGQNSLLYGLIRLRSHFLASI